MSASNDTAERFWAFALSIYLQPTARAAFLRMQDAHGFDVPLMLWCLWCDGEGRPVSEAVMCDAIAFSRAWRAAFVEPVRALRQGWKGGIGNFSIEDAAPPRAMIAKAEQDIERLQMDRLAAMAAAPTGQSTPCDATLIRYANCAGLNLPSADIAILRAAIADRGPRA